LQENPLGIRVRFDPIQDLNAGIRVPYVVNNLDVVEPAIDRIQVRDEVSQGFPFERLKGFLLARIPTLSAHGY